MQKAKVWARLRAIGLVLFAACTADDGSPPQGPSSITTERLAVTLTPDRDSILVGTTRQFTAAVTNQNGAPRTATLEWSSANPSVASVTNAGLVTALSAGSVQIIASIPGHADTALVNVHPGGVPLQIIPSAVNVTVGDDITLEASTAENTASMGGTVSWSSSDTTLAVVAPDGTVSGLQAGEVTLTATLSGATATAKVNVQPADINTITITPTVNSIMAGGRVNLNATARSATGARIEGVKFTWSSSDEGVATVSSNGTVTGLSRGFSIISAAAGDTRGSVSINVGPPPVASVVATLPDSSIMEGQTLQATATVKDSTGGVISPATLAWQSSNPAIATVTSTGQVTAIVDGNVNIIALSGGKTGSVPLTIGRRTASYVSITPSSPTVAVGTTTALSASLVDDAGRAISGATFSWSTGNANVASVTSAGLVTGVSLGETEITATSGSLSKTVRITVGGVPVASVAVTPTTANVQPGGSASFTASLRDAQGNVLSNRAVSWTSSNPSVATITPSGTATGVSTGTATITASAEGKTASAVLTVDPPPPGPITTVTVTLNAGTLSVGQVTQAVARAMDANGTVVQGTSFTWKTSDPAVATVTDAGGVTALKGGTVSILASTTAGTTGAATLAVNAPAPATVASITIALTPSSVSAGGTSYASVTLRDSAGNVLTGRSYGLSSDRAEVATVSVDGKVSALAAGTANIRATSGTKSATSALTVTSGTPAVASVRVSAPATVMNVGSSQTATAGAYDAAGNPVTGTGFTWTSSAPSVISVNANGQLSAVAAGSATITATAFGVSGTLGLTAVSTAPAPVATAQVSLNSGSIKVGQTTQAAVVLKDASGNVLNGRTVSWSSSNTTVATVGGSGLVTALAAGTAMISATSGGVTGSAPLNVAPNAVATVSLVLANPSLSIGSTTTSTVTLKDALGLVLTGLPIVYTSSNPAVASVNASGVVTAVSAGSANIVATASGINGTAAVTVVANAAVAAPELPRSVPVVPSNLVSAACTVNVPAGGLQAALNAARGGAVLCLTGTHTGNFTVPARTDAGWVVIRSAGSLPAGRMRPSLAGGLAKLVSNNVLAALQFAPRSVRTLVLGIEVTATPTLAPGSAPVSLVSVGSGNEATIADLPTDIAFQQVYVHGSPTLHIRRAFMLNGAAQTLRDSWCDEIHAAGYDSQCTISWNSPGPILIENNTLRAASENVMFGGADPVIPGVIARDVTVRQNHIEKPLTWKGAGWNVKNLIETKHSQRVLVEENVLEGSWIDGQVGYAFVLKSASTACAWCSSSDWTIRRNLIRKVGAAFSIAGRADQRSFRTDSTNRRFLIEDNWVEPLNVLPYNGDGRPLIFVADNQQITVRGNVFEPGNNNSAVVLDLSTGAPVTNLVMSRNVLTRGTYGFFASSTGEGLASWNKVAGASQWSSMAMVGGTNATYPPGTSWHASVSAALGTGAGLARSNLDAAISSVVQTP